MHLLLVLPPLCLPNANADIIDVGDAHSLCINSEAASRQRHRICPRFPRLRCFIPTAATSRMIRVIEVLWEVSREVGTMLRSMVD